MKKLIAEIKEIEKSLSHTLVRRKEQLKGIIWALENKIAEHSFKTAVAMLKRKI